MKNILALGLVFGLMGCTAKQAEQVGCAVEDTVATAVALTIKTELVCTNIEAIKASVKLVAAPVGLCKPQAQKTAGSTAVGAMAIDAGDLLCGPIVESLAQTASSAIPTAWGCKPDAKLADVKTKLLEVCKKAL